MSRVALYARVSTADGGQDAGNQLAQLREWCARSGHEIVAEYVDSVSGAKGADKRPRLAAMLDDAHRRRFDLVVVWALDRLSREGMVQTIAYMQKLAAAGVKFHSYSEPALSTENELVASILLAVMSALAKAERARISDRTRAGLARVKAKGVRLGRPSLNDAVRGKIARLGASGASDYSIGRQLGIDPKSVKRYRPPAIADAAD